jgi:hypothetical protein
MAVFFQKLQDDPEHDLAAFLEGESIDPRADGGAGETQDLPVAGDPEAAQSRPGKFGLFVAFAVDRTDRMNNVFRLEIPAARDHGLSHF